MKVNRNKKLIFFTILVLILLCLCIYKFKYQNKDANPYTQYVNNKESVNSINLLFNNENMISMKSLSIKTSNQDKKMSITTAKKILEILNLEKEKETILLDILDENKGKYVRREIWGKIIKEIDSSLQNENHCIETELNIFANSDMNSDLGDYEVISDEGKYEMEGYDTDLFIDTRIRVLIRQKQIIFIYDTDSSDVLFQNAYITSTEDDKINVYVCGVERKFRVKGLNQEVNNTLCNLTLKDKKVTDLSLKRDKITGKIIAVDQEGIEISGFLKIKFSNKVRVYKDGQINENCSINDIVVGDENAEFIVAEKEICGVYIKTEKVSGNIRVLLRTNGFKDYLHNQVTFTCNSDYSLIFNQVTSDNQTEEVIQEYQANQEIVIDANNDILQTSRIRIIPKDENGKVIIKSLKRAYGEPKYRGILEIAKMDDKLALINEVSIEEYLYSVVPSEMPSSYGVEALKVQAVCARSYALTHMSNKKLSAYGANVDDSTDFQVYNNTQETENSIEAVKKTNNEVVKYEGAVANTYFFATSCGSTTDGKIWSDNDVPYLQGKILNNASETKNLMDNDTFSTFIKEKYETFDSEYGWYRWNVTIPDEKIANGINNAIYNLYCSTPSLILTLENNEFVSKPIYSIGKLVNIEIAKRGSGGIIEELIITGTEKTVKIRKQSNIRNLLNPNGCNINKQDGTVVNTFTSMPSAYFTLEGTADKKGYIFYGGGYGHGAGMSQTAVLKMIENGMTYSDILKFFYSGVTLEKN